MTPDHPTGGTGAMIVVVGPSGAGKDSVIDYAMTRLKTRSTEVELVRRVITRAHDAGGEDHEAISPEAFCARAEQGAFAVHWEAHGLHYGIPAACHAKLKDGRTLVANGSRAVLEKFREAFPRVAVVNIVASPEVIAARLIARARESEAEIRQRLARQVPDMTSDPHLTTIDNSGPLEEAGERFAAFVLSLAKAEAS
ncbi:ribose-phosphate pyrophosphokinase [Rhizobium sp. Leaf371]|uniref:phosphonate metabolism protein/1,5-bisphosphokinase (PRPP-forming) PhnN n=1 Tax=unclassified Rhizobium TaxID=2613769 RepID=UPI0007125129|nr:MULTISPECIES: phosphonate metabolism protein/1,5-bisphosphokinase (PRPP-forming) PhnN [unclassified Rhizobium]KQS72009.1 ribose-phosphate pyrophosphokinase [Rhizobium sp. Leaf371]TCM54899.1 ribose 1,5-bisphosphokinase [Rhizobium sp. PP-F2F-G48]